MYQAGLVLEGGGMKGVYTCGVLDFFFIILPLGSLFFVRVSGSFPFFEVFFASFSLLCINRYGFLSKYLEKLQKIF